MPAESWNLVVVVVVVVVAAALVGVAVAKVASTLIFFIISYITFVLCTSTTY